MLLQKRFGDAVLLLPNVSGFSGEVPSNSEGLVRCKPVLAGYAKHKREFS